MIHKEDNEMKFKKVAALVLASAMTLGLAACGNGNSSTPSQSSGGASSSGTTSSSATEISLWAFNIGGFTEASNWDSLIAAFNEVNPDIKVTVTPINYQDGDQKLTSAITSGSGPDIIFEGPERIVGNYAREGLMVDLGDVWGDASADIGENISSVCQLDGTYYMYPLSAAAHCMAINYEVFEAAGALQYIDEETRTWTTEGFEAAMAAIKTAIDNGTVTVATPGIVYCGAQGGDQGTRALVNNLYSDYYVTEDGTSYNANSANNVKALTLLQNMVNAGSLSANASYAAADELTEGGEGEKQDGDQKVLHGVFSFLRLTGFCSFLSTVSHKTGKKSTTIKLRRSIPTQLCFYMWLIRPRFPQGWGPLPSPARGLPHARRAPWR